jgi:hypothetical protein
MAFDFSQATNFLSNFNNIQKHEILTVSSLQQAKDFAMNRGDSYLLLDPNADLLYIKEKDSIGKESLRVFGLQEVTEQYLNNSTPATISKTEYEKLLKRLELLEKGEKNVTKKSEQSELDFADK